MRKRNVGDRQRINIGNTWYDGVIVKISSVDTESAKGIFEMYSLDGYGDTQDFWYPDSAVANETVERRKSRSMMPPEYVYKRGRDFIWTNYGESTGTQRKIANAFVEKFPEFRKEGRGLYICSKTKGSGKTLLACCVANEVMERNDMSVKFVSVTEYIELLKGKTDQEKEIVRSIFDCGLLILDDIGAEVTAKDWVNSAVFRLVDQRDKNMLPTIYTSNYEMDELPEDERTVNRIFGHSIPVIMPEFSVRRMKAKKATGEFLERILQEDKENEQRTNKERTVSEQRANYERTTEA